MIPKNTALPASAEVTFCTGLDNQKNARIKILQNSKDVAPGTSINECQILTETVIEELPEGNAGEVKYTVKLVVNADEEITITTAQEADPTKKTSMTIRSKQGSLRPQELERLVREGRIRRGEQEEPGN